MSRVVVLGAGISGHTAAAFLRRIRTDRMPGDPPPAVFVTIVGFVNLL
jgi:glycine/D-amino acid oxidase-like deaminating enzyme